MTYTTVFDLSRAGFGNWWFAAPGLLFVAIGASQLLRARTPPAPGNSRPGGSRVTTWALLGLAAVWTLTAFASTYGDYRRLRAAERSGEMRTVEGPVENFHPMPWSGHAMERFCVQGRCFAYSDFIVTAGFHRTAAYGGPIRAGLPVRVSYVGDTIVKLEVGAKPPRAPGEAQAVHAPTATASPGERAP